MSAEPLTLSRFEAARALGVSLSSINRRLRDGELPSVRVGGRRLIPRNAVYDALATSVEELLGVNDYDDVADPHPAFNSHELDILRQTPGLAESAQAAAKRLAAQVGPGTRHNSRAAVAVHEASHAVVATLDGRTVSRVSIALSDVMGWTGATESADGVTTASPTRSVARQLIAGVVGENAFVGPAPGAEIREQILCGICCETVAAEEGVRAEDVHAETLASVLRDLEANVGPLFLLAARLEERGEVAGDELAELLGAVHG